MCPRRPQRDDGLTGRNEKKGRRPTLDARDLPRYTPAFRRFHSDIKVFHFAGSQKPWVSRARQPDTYTDEVVRRWWSIHDRHMSGQSTPGLPATIVVRPRTPGARRALGVCLWGGGR